MPERVKDAYAQIAYLSCTESAANTLTFAKLEVATGALLGEKKYAMVIQRAHYWMPAASLALFVGNGDIIQTGLTVSPNITNLSLSNPEVVDMHQWESYYFGAAATAQWIEMPYVADFTGFGGLLVPADKLYLGVQANSLATASTIQVRLWYTMKELSVAEYWDLVEARRIIST